MVQQFTKSTRLVLVHVWCIFPDDGWHAEDASVNRCRWSSEAPLSSKAGQQVAIESEAREECAITQVTQEASQPEVKDKVEPRPNQFEQMPNTAPGVVDAIPEALFDRLLCRLGTT